MEGDWEPATRSVQAGAVFSAERPPFRRLRPALEYADVLLSGPQGGWARLASVVGDEQACTDALNTLLADAGVTLRVGRHGDEWALLARDGTDAYGEAAACCAVALLVQHSGWGRLVRCAQPSCDRVFLDWSNGGTRRQCRHHGTRPRQPTGELT